MWSRAAAIASNIAWCVRGPSTSRRAWLPPTNGFSGGAGRAAEPAFGGASAHPERAASSAAKTAPTAKRPGTLALQPDIVLHRADALHLLRRRHGASHLVFRVDEAGELDHSAVGLDVDRRGGPRPRVGRDGALHLGGDRRVIGELAGAAAIVAVLRGRACAQPGNRRRCESRGKQPAP